MNLHAGRRERREGERFWRSLFSTRVGVIILLVLVGALGLATNRSSDSSMSTGYLGAVAVGLDLRGPGVDAVELTRTVSDLTALDAMVVVARSRVEDPRCDDVRACVERSDIAIPMTMSILLDLDELVVERNEWLIEGDDSSEHTIDLDLSGLASGTHCLVVVTSEPAVPMLEEQFPDHSSAAYFTLVVQDEEPNHCSASFVPLTGERADGCYGPLMNGAPEARMDARVDRNDGVFAHVSHCSDGETTALVLLDGVPALDPVATPFPATTDQDETTIVQLSDRVEASSARLLTITPSQGITAAKLSRPILMTG